MDPSARELAAATTNAAAEELVNAAKKVVHCLKQLTDEQVWWRPAPAMNSIGNLILHLCGNVRQWIIAGVGGAEDTRNRPGEFAERGPIATAELQRNVDKTVSEATDTLANASPAVLIENRRIQGFDVTGISAVFQSVAHFQGHVQEIIHLTRRQLGDDYEFDFVPATPEQGAP